MTGEADEARVKRLRIRAWRRGTKEMDLILGGWYDRNLAILGEAQLAGFDALLDEEDHDIYQWVTKKSDAPEQHRELVAEIASAVADGGVIFST